MKQNKQTITALFYAWLSHLLIYMLTFHGAICNYLNAHLTKMIADIFAHLIFMIISWSRNYYLHFTYMETEIEWSAIICTWLQSCRYQSEDSDLTILTPGSSIKITEVKTTELHCFLMLSKGTFRDLVGQNIFSDTNWRELTFCVFSGALRILRFGHVTTQEEIDYTQWIIHLILPCVWQTFTK